MDFLSQLFLFTSLVLLLSIFTAQILAWKLTKRKRKYPPIAGTILHQLLNFNRLHDYMTDLAAKYKTYRLIGPFRNEVYTSNPQNVEYILKTNFDNYGKGWYNYNMLKDLLGDGIFMVDGDKWRQQRKISSHEFSTRMLREFSSAVFQKNAAKVADKLSEIAAANQTIDIQDMFMKSTLDSIFKPSVSASDLHPFLFVHIRQLHEAAAHSFEKFGIRSCTSTNTHLPTAALGPRATISTTGSPPWRRDFTGGFILDMGVHFIAGLKMLAGCELVSVSATTSHVDKTDWKAEKEKQRPYAVCPFAQRQQSNAYLQLEKALGQW